MKVKDIQYFVLNSQNDNRYCSYDLENICSIPGRISSGVDIFMKVFLICRTNIGGFRPQLFLDTV